MKQLIIFIVLFFLVGCVGSSFRPMVDMQGQSQARYNSDLYG